MKLNINLRPTEKKRDSKRLRREGFVPAVVYGSKTEAKNITLSENEFQSVLRKVQKGRLSTTVFTLQVEKGKPIQAVIKDIQYHPTTYRILHLDFEELQDNVPVKINVPIEFSGVGDCAGVKQGGVLRQVTRNLRVACLPKDIPSCFIIDVKNLGVKQHKRLSEIELPETIRPVGSLDEVAVVVAKR